MKVILLQNLENLGLPGQIANVKTGYYRNYLMPRKLAAEASESNLKSLEQKRQKLNREAEKIVNEAKTVADRLREVTLKFTEKVAEHDRLFGSVNVAEIAAKLAEQGFDIERRRIMLGAPIKTTGNHTASIRLHANLAVPIKIIVEGEGGPAPEAATAKPEAAADEDAPKPETAAEPVA